MNPERKRRKDVGVPRTPARTPDVVFTFKLNPDDPIEGPIYQKLKDYLEEYPRSLRGVIRECLAEFTPSPPNHAAAFSGLQQEFGSQLKRLEETIDKLMASGIQTKSNATPQGEEGGDGELDLSYIARIKATFRRGAD